jgi:hypothetical protein
LNVRVKFALKSGKVARIGLRWCIPNPAQIGVEELK